MAGALLSGHFAYIELPIPIYHPDHIMELKGKLSLLCLNSLKIKKHIKVCFKLLICINMKTNVIDSNIFLYFNCILFKYFELNYKKFLVTFDVSSEVNITLHVCSFWLVLYSQVILATLSCQFQYIIEIIYIMKLKGKLSLLYLILLENQKQKGMFLSFNDIPFLYAWVILVWNLDD